MIKGRNGHRPQFEIKMTSISVNDLFVVDGLGMNSLAGSGAFEHKFNHFSLNFLHIFLLTLVEWIFTKMVTLKFHSFGL